MAKIYIASNEVERTRRVMKDLISAGHTITFDWTLDIENESEETRATKPLREREAIKECDVLIYLWKENQESARFEAGMAMGLGKKIIVAAPHKAWFFTLPEIIQIDSDDQILSAMG